MIFISGQARSVRKSFCVVDFVIMFSRLPVANWAGLDTMMMITLTYSRASEVLLACGTSLLLSSPLTHS